jgi:geranylgeranyl pyrophosphate synthase
MMEKLLKHKAAIDDDLVRMSAGWRKEWEQKYTPVTLEVLDCVIDFLNRGGKRVRGALAMESYYLHGGTNNDVAIGAARVIELVQAYLLIMDDIQDKSAMRRGGKTVHIQLAEGHNDHYGIAQGLNAEMLVNHRAMSELMSLPASDADKIRAAKLLNEDISVTIVGQINDIYNQVAPNMKRETIIDTLTWKTAYYTFVSPLELGACLAGREQLDERLHEYALNAGVAFQISDDILGVFGDSFEVGKSADDDIREGKATLLAAHAYEHADTEQLKILENILGKSDASNDECGQVRDVFAATGAREYATQTAQEYADKAEAALGETPEDFLVELVRFAVSRKS